LNINPNAYRDPSGKGLWDFFKLLWNSKAIAEEQSKGRSSGKWGANPRTPEAQAWNKWQRHLKRWPNQNKTLGCKALEADILAAERSGNQILGDELKKIHARNCFNSAYKQGI
jgi:hypothetical protein